MILNQANLARATTGFQTIFNNALGQAPSVYKRIATHVPSSTKDEKYGWLGKVPGMREWLGDRVIHGVGAHDYAIKNKDWELTIGVDRNDIQDDTLGVYAPLIAEMGMAAGAKPDELVFGLIKEGFSTVCYDGQNFFDTDHPVLDAAGVPQSVANTDGGAGTPWFLMDPGRAIKAVIYQERQANQFVPMDKIDDENVFMRKEFLYGVDARSNVGFGLWQLCWGSKQTLDATNYELAFTSLGGMKGDYGRPLGLNMAAKPLLIYPPSLEGKARALIKQQRVDGGDDNVWFDSAELLMSPWLA